MQELSTTILPPEKELRDRLAKAMREVELLSGLIKLSERLSRRDGRQVGPSGTQMQVESTVSRG